MPHAETREYQEAPTIQDKPFFCSWSGGKDCCLALYHAIRMGGMPHFLFTMMTEDIDRSRSHGLSAAILGIQARALSIPLITESSTWGDYDCHFQSALKRFSNKGIEWGVFGDIDGDSHLEWVDRVCTNAGIRYLEPLWKKPRLQLLYEFIDLGFEALIVALKEDLMDEGFLGRRLDRRLIKELEREGIDASGESGEYHTLVTGGPLFTFSLEIETGEQVSRNGYLFQDFRLKTAET